MTLLRWLLQDMDLVPLLIQENYLNHRPAHCGNDLQHMRVRRLLFSCIEVARICSQGCSIAPCGHRLM